MDRICEVSDEVIKELVATADKAGLDTGVCPVDAAYHIAQKVAEVSCGKGVFCREGMLQMFLIIEDIRAGKGTEEDVDNVEKTLDVIVECADCDLSHTAAVCMSKLVKDFREEWIAHVKRKTCANLVCPGCHTVHINAATCTGNGACIKACEFGAIKGGAGMFSVIDQNKCTSCDKCIAACPSGAIKPAGFIKPQGPTAPGPVGSWGAGAGAGGGRRRRG